MLHLSDQRFLSLTTFGSQTNNHITSIPDDFDSATNWPQCAKVINDIRDQSMCGESLDIITQMSSLTLFAKHLTFHLPNVKDAAGRSVVPRQPLTGEIP